MGKPPSPELRKLACDMVAKAYEHHKTHARFEETQRAWMVTAYFTFTALVFVGLAGRYADPQFGSLWLGMVAVHLMVSVLFMVSVSKVSGEFRRHFTRAEKILKDLQEACAEDEELKAALRHVILETAAIREDWSGKRRWVVLFSNAAVHSYMFSLLSACDIYLLVNPALTRLAATALVESRAICVSSWLALAAAIFWFVLAAGAQHWYINRLEQTGT